VDAAVVRPDVDRALADFAERGLLAGLDPPPGPSHDHGHHHGHFHRVEGTETNSVGAAA